MERYIYRGVIRYRGFIKNISFNLLKAYEYFLV